jgi:chaperone modulatory protein CbpM
MTNSNSRTIVLSVRSHFAYVGPLTLDDVAQAVNTPRPVLERLLEEEIVRPQEVRGSERLFAPEQIQTIERSIRLHEELGVNWAGVAIIHDLLGKVELLQHELGRRAWSEGEVQDTECE